MLTEKMIDEMKVSKRKLYMSITGGGLRAFSLFSENGGASDVFLGGQIPYNPEDLTYLIGPHSKAVDRRTALLLSRVGYNRSIADTLEGTPNDLGCCGIGATSSLVKKGGVERNGREHKICIAVSTFSKNECTYQDYVEVLLNEKRTRKEEEDITANLILLMADMSLCLRKAHHFHPTFRKSLNNLSGLTNKDTVNWELNPSE